MKKYECTHVSSHKRIAEAIHDYQKKGWRLHTYQCMQGYHYLLFEREAGS